MAGIQTIAYPNLSYANIKAFMYLIRYCEGTLDNQGNSAVYSRLGIPFNNNGYYRLYSTTGQNYINYPVPPTVNGILQTSWLDQGYPNATQQAAMAAVLGNSYPGGTHPAGAYQFEPATWKSASFPSLTTKFNPSDQDLVCSQYLINLGVDNLIKSGDVYGAINKMGPGIWTSLPCCNQPSPNLNNYGGDSSMTQLAAALTIFQQQPGATLDDNNKGYIKNNNTCADVKNSDGTATDAAAQARLNKQLQENLNAIQNNVNMLEVEDTQVKWGARHNSEEQSDWIGLKQYLLYLATLYTPQSVVPFFELIPKFLLDEPTSNTQNTVETTEPSIQAIIDQKKRFEKTTQQFLDLQKGNLGYGTQDNVTGIDLLTVDPFRDMLTSANESKSHSDARIAGTLPSGNSAKTSAQQRNFGYRLYGNVVLNPEIMGDEMSKAGGIGFKSFEISKGASVMQSVTNINIKLVDIQGNKFFDTASPWSFILNSSQVYGDFYFRYGWQLRIPKYDSKNSDKSSTEYKFWNHPGWNLFSNLDNSTTDQQAHEAAKSYIYSLAKRSGTDTLTLTQSNNLSSIYYPGYTVAQSGAELFSVDRSQLNPNNYLVISMIAPEISIDSHTGAVTASIQFRMNTAMMTCMVPMSADNIKNVMAAITDTNSDDKNKISKTVGLIQLMVAFLNDNLVYSENTTAHKKINSSEEIKAIKTVISNGGKGDRIGNSNPPIYKCNFDVRTNDGKTLNYDQIENMCILNIKSERIQEIGGALNTLSGTVPLRAWIAEVLSDNNMTMIGAGDPGLGNMQQQSTFVILWNDSFYNADFLRTVQNKQLYPNNDFNNIFDSGTGFLGASDMSTRLLLQDDVFSFRFRGSLIEELNIDGQANPSAQNNENMIALAGKAVLDSINKDIKNNKTGEQLNQLDLLKNKLYDAANQQSVTYDDKAKWFLYNITKISGLTVKCMGHPWLGVGMSVYVKGNGYFDGKYIITKVTHNLSDDNKFTSTINGVRVLNDQDYANTQNAQKNISKSKMNGQSNWSRGITPGAVVDNLKVKPAPPQNSTPTNTKGR